MANYNDPDEWISNSRIPWGTDENQTEPIKRSWVATNRAAHAAWDLCKGIAASITDLPNQVVGAIGAYRWPYGNQEGVPDDKKLTDNLFESTRATNTRVFSPVFGLAALAGRLDAQDKVLAGQDKALSALRAQLDAQDKAIAAIAAKVGLPNQ